MASSFSDSRPVSDLDVQCHGPLVGVVVQVVVAALDARLIVQERRQAPDPPAARMLDANDVGAEVGQNPRGEHRRFVCQVEYTRAC